MLKDSSIQAVGGLIFTFAVASIAGCTTEPPNETEVDVEITDGAHLSPRSFTCIVNGQYQGDVPGCSGSTLADWRACSRACNAYGKLRGVTVAVGYDERQ